jgi:tetratricopeptide (TPR) repeat protein
MLEQTKYKAPFMTHRIFYTMVLAGLLCFSAPLQAQTDGIQNLLPEEGASLDESLTVLQIPVEGDEAENLTIMQIPSGEPVQAPSSAALSSPRQPTPSRSRDIQRLEQVRASEASGASRSAQQNVPDGVFYDSNNIPAGEMTRNQGPISVDPRTKIGSRFVVVRETHGAGSREAAVASAQRAMSLGRYASALQIFEDLHRSNSRSPQVAMGRAIALQRLGRLEEAVLAYNDFLALKPNDINARVNMLGVMSQKYPAVALRQLLDLRREHSSHVGVTAQLAVTYAQTNDIDNAMKFLGVAAGMEPENPIHVYNMAVIADTSKKQKDAVLFYEEALEIDAVYGSKSSLPRDEIYERLARIR